MVTHELTAHVDVDQFAVPPHQEGAVVVWKNPRRRERARFHGSGFRPSLMDLRHKAQEGEALRARHEPRRFACGL